LGASLDGVHTDADYAKAIEACIDKKGSEPLRYIQKKLESVHAFDDVITQIKNLPHGTTQTIYYEPAKKFYKNF